METAAQTIPNDQFHKRAAELGFNASCEALTGQFLCTLAASKPGSQVLELGTGVGLGSAHLLAGMNGAARLTTVELDSALSAAAQAELGHDPRIRFVVDDGAEWLTQNTDRRYDLIFADTWPGKFSELNEALALLKPGGIYFIDDLLPQANWPERHQEKVDDLRRTLEARADLRCTYMDWATGLMVCVKLELGA
ncbi:O-methyltransferase [Deinococcus sp. SM5_A1]|uniref:O-methyltransferase n=1 Tax=Deinococcus sp. SM5_A1 TaxID=3379094 RepID=UPI003858F77B